MVIIGLFRPRLTESNKTEFGEGFGVGSAVVVVFAIVVVFAVVVVFKIGVLFWSFLNCDGSPEHGLLHWYNGAGIKSDVSSPQKQSSPFWTPK